MSLHDTSVLRPGPARRVDPGPGRPGSKQKTGWELARPDPVDLGPSRPGQTRLRPEFIFLYILMPETTLFWPFTIKRPKQQEQRDESRMHCRAEK